MRTSKLGRRLASNPKLLHALFVALFVLTQAGMVTAQNNNGYTGP